MTLPISNFNNHPFIGYSQYPDIAYTMVYHKLIPNIKYKVADSNPFLFNRVCCVIALINKLIIQNEFFVVLKKQYRKVDENESFSICSKSIFMEDYWVIIDISPNLEKIKPKEMSTEECKENYTSYIDGETEKMTIDKIGINSFDIWKKYISSISDDIIKNFLNSCINSNIDF